MRRLLLLLPAALALALVAGAEQAGEARGDKILITFSSYRERPKHPQIYFYEHDGVGQGKIVGSIPTVNQRSDYHPALSQDGRYCALAAELENQTSRIFVWDREEKKLLDPPKVNANPNGQIHPALSGDGKLLVFAAWNRSGFSQRWDLVLSDLTAKDLRTAPKLNTPRFDERMPALSADGRLLAFVSNAKEGLGLTDIYLYDVKAGAVIAIPELNSPHSELTPSLSGDGNLVAFTSDRPGGKGGRDVYLYDRKAKRFVELPGLNSVANEQTPWLSADGRYLTFVSERVSGEGERDVYLYDVKQGKPLPTPGLNSKREDMDPCVIVLR